MRKTDYKELMEALDAAVYNGYEDELLELSPEAILDDIVDCTRMRWMESVPTRELHRAIQDWQERQYDDNERRWG